MTNPSPQPDLFSLPAPVSEVQQRRRIVQAIIDNHPIYDPPFIREMVRLLASQGFNVDYETIHQDYVALGVVGA